MIFQTIQLKKTSVLQKIFKQKPEENAIIRVNNLLAMKQIRDIQPADIAAIEKEYEVKLAVQFVLNLEEFYAVYLGFSLRKNTLSDDDIADLAHLKVLFKLSDKSVESLHIRLGEKIFRTAFSKAIADGRLGDQKENTLAVLGHRIGIPKRIIDAISIELRTAYVSNFVKKLLAEQRYSPDEEQELEAITSSLNINPVFDNAITWKLQKLKLYWQLENLPLPVVQPNIMLQKGEVCHMYVPNVSWYELRKVTLRTGRTGYAASIKIAKGFYLRSSSYTPHRYSTDQMTFIDSGVVYLTGKRIIFTGKTKNSNIRLEKILDFTPLNDGVQIHKDAGKSPQLRMPTSVDVFCLILARVLNT